MAQSINIGQYFQNLILHIMIYYRLKMCSASALPTHQLTFFLSVLCCLVALQSQAQKEGELARENGYPTTKIGEQTWMSINLRVSYFRNGDPIPYAENKEEWMAAAVAGEPAWCFYDFDPEMGKKHGKLYNWYAVNDPRGLAPKGWRVPTNDDWDILLKYVDKNAQPLKSETGWARGGNGTNETGFSATPSGIVKEDTSFRYEGEVGYYWTNTDLMGNHALAKQFIDYTERVNSPIFVKAVGCSVRCVREG